MDFAIMLLVLFVCIFCCCYCCRASVFFSHEITYYYEANEISINLALVQIMNVPEHRKYLKKIAEWKIHFICLDYFEGNNIITNGN